jgi:CheY-like chemotaxis protein/HPt (histidine-containing phosphotransfer) domain-containing protein
MAVQDKLFSAFTQADGSTTRQFGGTGLGLAISRQLAGLMQGQVGMESVEFEGSTFWAELPFERGTEYDQLAVVPETGLPVSAEARLDRLLLVEDNSTNQLVALGLLRKLGFQNIVAVNNGEEAIAWCAQNTFDLILMDCQMPVLDGYQATRRLREQGCAVPIIAMTANAMRGDREQCLAVGMNDYIAKPIAPTVLQDVLQQWLGKPVAVSSVPDAVVQAAQCPVFDRQAALNLMAGDEAILCMAIESGLVDIPLAMRALVVALDAGMASDARRQAHTLKSVAANIGGTALRTLAASAEHLAEQGKLKEVQAMLPMLGEAVSALQSEAGREAAALPATA